MQHLSGAPRRFEILARVVSQAELQSLSDRRLLDHVAVPVELVADRRADEVGAVGIEAFLHHQVDMAEVDIAQIDRDLLAVGDPAKYRAHCWLCQTSFYHPMGWFMDVKWMLNCDFQGGADRYRASQRCGTTLFEPLDLRRRWGSFPIRPTRPQRRIADIERLIGSFRVQSGWHRFSRIRPVGVTTDRILEKVIVGY